MEKTDDAGRAACFEDKRMWRLLLARLHPDAGGNHELFTFACAVKEELLGADSSEGRGGCDEDTPRGTGPHPNHFLRTWQDSMSRWSVNNHDTLRDFRAR